ncbi:hypothetical protein GNI_103900 [Gregarina niphandrodes]|uniref:Transmembrane protein n=1 Tax=Gregarina niphandrodes TaxID=110365 RepID=A0A023B448_GRENI|nr:hypothetical protein GNI_103900 [Gregarina niphandrodes]EZG56398.1 hypothetical protein GNI_103900 [Gregarina niphandrodes]|eukprot:XP_011131271.1 hypothetical protein GNI_103900 [Gregarina niphandrodes]
MFWRQLLVCSVALGVSLQEQSALSSIGSAVSGVTTRAKNLVQSVPGSTTVSCLTASDKTKCKKEAAYTHQLETLMLKGTTDIDAMQKLYQLRAHPQIEGLTAAQENDLFHQTAKKLSFDTKQYELVASGFSSTSASSTTATVAPTAAAAALTAVAPAAGVVAPAKTATTATTPVASVATTAAPTAAAAVKSLATTVSTTAPSVGGALAAMAAH